MRYAVKVKWAPGNEPYIATSRTRPYTTRFVDAKHWKTRAAAERYLALKDPDFAARCSVEEQP